MATVSVVSTGSAVPLTSLTNIPRKPIFCSWLFLLCDLIAIAVTSTIVLFSRRAGDGALDIHRYLALWPALAIVGISFASSHLYPGIIHHAVDELRRLWVALTVSFLAIGALLVVDHGVGYPRLVFLFWWAGAMVVTPLLRSLVRDAVCRRPWWGIPVAVFHTGRESTQIVEELQAHPEIGLRPVVLLSSPLLARPRHCLPVLDVRLAPAVRACGVERTLIVLSDAESGPLLEELENYQSIFPRLMLFHHSAALYNLTVDARQVGGRLAVEVRRDLLLPVPRMAKRGLDLLIVALALPMVTMILLLAAVLVRMESPGPVLFAHRRIGRDRATFRTWKIRTMQVNGDAVLEKALAQNHDLREEWSRDRKLRNDPRITRVGRLLRKTSLDELPQFWNVLRGEMSLVGPRPIVEEEVAAYGKDFSLYCRVTPGLTGLWQVSGRSDVSSSDRVRLDSYYVRNWSPWLDLHILARTAKVVLTGQGAY